MEFEFDVAVDTASDVATEMVTDLELTPEDAAVIATCIRDELARLSALPEVGARPRQGCRAAPTNLQAGMPKLALSRAKCICFARAKPHFPRIPSRLPCRSTRTPQCRWRRPPKCWRTA